MAEVFTTETFETEVLNSDIPVVVDFYADWCGPCKMMLPIVEKLAEEFAGRVKIGKVNTDNDEAIAMNYRIMSIPCFLFFKGGKLVDKAVGAMSESDFKDRINELLD